MKKDIFITDPQYLETYMDGYKDGKLNLTLDLYDFIYNGHTAEEVKTYCIKLYHEERATNALNHYANYHHTANNNNN